MIAKLELALWAGRQPKERSDHGSPTEAFIPVTNRSVGNDTSGADGFKPEGHSWHCSLTRCVQTR